MRNEDMSQDAALRATALHDSLSVEGKYSLSGCSNCPTKQLKEILTLKELNRLAGELETESWRGNVDFYSHEDDVMP